MRGLLFPVLLVALYTKLFLSSYIESTIIKKGRPLNNNLQRKEREEFKTFLSNDESPIEENLKHSEQHDKLRKKASLSSENIRRGSKGRGSQNIDMSKSIKKRVIGIHGNEKRVNKRDFYFRPLSPYGQMVNPADQRMYLMHRKERGPCFTHACHHGGMCIPRRHSFYCECLPGFIGTKCEVKRECKSTTCKNGGSCTEIALGKHLCTCPVGFLGDSCEERSRCHPTPCRNGGTCSETEESYTCMCEEGFKGKDCETINKCSPNPCKNAGICFEMDNDFVCNCPQGFKGKTCEVISECLSIYCLNGGTCRDETSGYKCVCPFGYYGKRCEVQTRLLWRDV